VTAVEIDVVVTAQVPMPAAYVYRGTLRGESVHARCLAYVVRHPQAGTFLVDTGFHADARESARKDFGVAIGLLFRGLKPVEQPFDAQLRERGIDPAAVDRVVMTHLHADHTSGLRHLPNAEVVVDRREWKAAHARGASLKGFVPHHLPSEERVRLVEPSEPFGPFAGTLDLLGDGSVRVISTPGHTPGHLSVLLKTSDGDVLVAGDAAYTLRNVREQILPLITADDGASRRSLAELKAFMDAQPEAIVVPTHDPDAWQRL
jgi:glyoxylase-like metal-dependent hydrolase (beta-lactamase superfamily II)